LDARLTAQRFDLVILDLGLPLISGRAVRDELLAHARICVVVTGLTPERTGASYSSVDT